MRTASARVWGSRHSSPPPLCLGCGRPLLHRACSCGTSVPTVSWSRVPCNPWRAGLCSLPLGVLGLILLGGAIVPLAHLVQRSPYASSVAWIIVSAWSVAAFALGAYCFWLAIAAWVVTRWELFSDDDTVAGMINTVFGRLESGVVLRRMITRRVTAGPITSIDVLNAGLDEVAEHTRGRISADSALLLACLMGLVSSGAASLVVADTHGWTKPHPWSRTRRSSPIQTLLLSRNDVEPASLPVLEQRCLVALSSLERTMAPQRRFELSNVVRVLAHMSVEPSRPPPGDDRNASQIARALVQFFEHIGGDALGLEDVPSELRMTAVHLSALVTRERAPCATALAP